MKKTALSALLIITAILNCFSQQRFYDTSFGNNGVVTYPDQEGILVKINKAGNKLYGLITTLNNDTQYTVKRYNLDGSIDPDFTAPTLNGNYWNRSSNFQGFVSETSTGKIIVAHNSFNITNYWEPWDNLVRLNQDGSIDTTYGTNGFASLTNSTWDSLELLNMELLENDDTILTAYANQEVFIKKFDDNGSPYTNVWNNGKLSYNYTSNEFPNAALFSKTENCMYVAFSTTYQGPTLTATKIVKINLGTGLPETSFGVNGVMNIDGYFNRFALTEDNKLITITKTDGYFKINKFNSNGVRDTNFANGSAGFLIVDSDAYFTRKIAIKDGKITILYGTSNNIIIHRLNEDGTPDTSFGGSGEIHRQNNGNQIITSAFDLLFEDNKLLLSGQISSGSESPALYSFLTNTNLNTDSSVSLKDTILYPNPSSGEVFIKSSGTVEHTEIYNAIGQLVTKSNVMNNRIDVSTLCAGTYIVKLYTSDNIQHTEKLIKK
jgi:uncharacterized delta-60 repeat protein